VRLIQQYKECLLEAVFAFYESEYMNSHFWLANSKSNPPLSLSQPPAVLLRKVSEGCMVFQGALTVFVVVVKMQ